MPSGAVSDIELLPRCADFTLLHSRSAEQRVLEELETNTGTSLFMTLRMLRLQRAVLAVGMFSLFEALLQTHLGWDAPFKQLNEYLIGRNHCRLAETFSDYLAAVNVLKHGRGRSYDQLSAKRSVLEFKLMADGARFFQEGEMSEVNVLIDADDKFVRRCASLIEEISFIIPLYGGI